MKVGDLVRHLPERHTVAYKLYQDWGHESDFKSGIVLEVENGFARVMPSQTKKPSWYKFEELEVLSEAR
tara:strand:+ start:845 stop:1051 length:207 start_codon:yes stop_codon:yes gene_type:complete